MNILCYSFVIVYQYHSPFRKSFKTQKQLTVKRKQKNRSVCSNLFNSLFDLNCFYLCCVLCRIHIFCLNFGIRRRHTHVSFVRFFFIFTLESRRRIWHTHENRRCTNFQKMVFSSFSIMYPNSQILTKQFILIAVKWEYFVVSVIFFHEIGPFLSVKTFCKFMWPTSTFLFGDST